MALFQKAERAKVKLRMLMQGASGAGKSLTALYIAKALAESEGKKIAFIDTEHDASLFYADEVPHDHVNITRDYHPDRFIDALKEAEKAGYGVAIIDNLSAEWSGIPNGVSDLADQFGKKPGMNDFTKWKLPKKFHAALWEEIKSSNMHIICTYWMKPTRVMDKDSNTGRTVIKDIGLQIDGDEQLAKFFDLRVELDQDHTLRIIKSRLLELNDVIAVDKPNVDFGLKILDALQNGKLAPAEVEPPSFRGEDIVEPAKPAPKVAKPKPVDAMTTEEKIKKNFNATEEYLDEETYTKYFRIGKATGYTKDEMLIGLQQIGLNSLKTVPKDMEQALSDMVSSKEVLDTIRSINSKA